MTETKEYLEVRIASIGTSLKRMVEISMASL